MQGMCHLSKPMSASRPETHFYKVRHETANSVRTLALVQGNKKTPSSKCGYRKKQKKQKNFQSATPKCFFFLRCSDLCMDCVPTQKHSHWLPTYQRIEEIVD